MSERLERISIAGYKSIRTLEDFSLNPGLNVLIGANGSGKTNFIKFFELLRHLVEGSLQRYISQHGGADAFLFRGMKITPELRAELVLGDQAYEFALGAANDRSMFVAHESIPGDRSDGSYKESSLLRKSAFGQMVRDWRVYHFHDTSPSAGVMGRVNIVDNDILRGDAGNLAAFLMRLERECPDCFFRIGETVRQVAPFFSAFDLRELEQGQTQLLWKDRASDLVYYPYQLSDGTLRYICLATLLLQPEPPSTIIIDEPELGLHPFAIDLLSSLLSEASEKSQIITSTQSMQLIDNLQPAQIIVANHHDGATVLEHLDEQRLNEWLEDYSLGELCWKNQLGGNP